MDVENKINMFEVNTLKQECEVIMNFMVSIMEEIMTFQRKANEGKFSFYPESELERVRKENRDRFRRNLFYKIKQAIPMIVLKNDFGYVSKVREDFEYFTKKTDMVDNYEIYQFFLRINDFNLNTIMQIYGMGKDQLDLTSHEKKILGETLVGYVGTLPLRLFPYLESEAM